MPIRKRPLYGCYWLLRLDPEAERWQIHDLPSPLLSIHQARKEALRLAKRAEWRGAKFAILNDQGVQKRAAVYDARQKRAIWTILSEKERRYADPELANHLPETGG